MSDTAGRRGCVVPKRHPGDAAVCATSCWQERIGKGHCPAEPLPATDHEAGWPFGAESALRLIAATGNPNERKENRDAWAITMPARPDVMAVEIARARTRLEQAIAYVLPADAE